jgi:8-oxo-dGTP pyrophosphatase MutT (NUDIX family)
MPRFSSDAFLARAAQRLDRVPVMQGGEGGDHVLNPDIVAADMTYLNAAVLIPVVARRPEAGVLLTQRTTHLTAHAGQIAFPGGKIDPADAGPAAAALREAEEEIGLDPGAVAVIGYLNPYLTRTGYRVVPVVGRIAPDLPLRLNRNEVADVFEVPLAVLMAPANHRRASRIFSGRERYFYEIPFGERVIWGATAGIIRDLYERVLG